MIEDKNPQRTSLEQLGEFGLIEHLTKNFKIEQKSTIKGIGDDAAVLDFKSKQIVPFGNDFYRIFNDFPGKSMDC